MQLNAATNDSYRHFGRNPAYSAAAIERQLQALANTPAGQGLRNKALNDASFAIGRFVGAGEISEVEAKDRLMQAAEANGYAQNHGDKATRSVIECGLEAGQREPYPVPRAHDRRPNGRPKSPSNRHRASSGVRASSAIGASSPNLPPQQVTRELPPIYFSPIEANAAEKPPLPSRTPPNENGKPYFEAGGNEGPPHWKGELRRHLYRSHGVPIKAKIKFENGNWLNWYRVADSNGTEGWQTEEPSGYVHVPYLSHMDPFDLELTGDAVFWTEGEKDCDTLGKHHLPAFTFGGGDGVPREAEKYVAGRAVNIVADRDEEGRRNAEKRAQLAAPVAASVRIVHFPELKEKGDVTDFFDVGGTAEELIRRADEAPLWEQKSDQASAEEETTRQANGRALLFASLAEIEPKAVSWIWEDRIPLGKQVIFTGDPDVGKTTVMIDIMARITKGELWPDGSGAAPLGSVILLTGEDGIEDTIRPRAEAAGADLSRIHVVQAAYEEDGSRAIFNLQSDLALLGDKIKALGDVKVIAIDPITAYLGAGQIDTHKTSDVRALLAELKEFAEEHGVAVCSITHPPKNIGSKAMNAATGSLAFVAAARASYLFMRDTENERMLMLPIKSNLGKAKGGLAYRIGGCQISNGIVASQVLWDSDPVSLTADEALAAATNRSSDPTAKSDAIEFLSDLLANGPMQVADIEREARAAGLLSPTQPIGQSKPFRSARTSLRIETRKQGMNGGWSWALPPKVPRGGEDAF